MLDEREFAGYFAASDLWAAGCCISGTDDDALSRTGSAHMPLRTVELFCDVVALRSFSKAAVERAVTQSSVSQSISLLEKRLGVQLIDRGKRPFELTPAGAVYHEECRSLLESSIPGPVPWTMVFANRCQMAGAACCRPR